MENQLISMEEQIYNKVKDIIIKAKNRVYKSVNTVVVKAYWEIGQEIIEGELQGKERADYGKYLIKYLSKKLTEELGKGYSETNLRNMKIFYSKFPNYQTLSDELEFSHYVELCRVKDENARNFYLVETMKSNWTARELQRQRTSLLFERLTLSKSKDEVLEIANKGHEISSPSDVVKSPIVLEFLGLKESEKYLEKDLEKALIDHLQEFMLELRKRLLFC